MSSMLAWGSASAGNGVLPVAIPEVAATADRFEVSHLGSEERDLVAAPVRVPRILLVNFPATGVYRLRFWTADTQLWQEDIFVRLNDRPVGQVMRLAWETPRQGPTLLRVIDSRQQTRSQTIEQSTIELDGTGAPWLLSLRQEQRAVSDLRLLDATPTPEGQGPAVSILGFDPEASDDDQVVAEPEHPELLDSAVNRADIPQRGERQPLPPLVRSHRLDAFVKFFHETFRVDREERYLSPKGQGLGSGIGIVYNASPILQTNVEYAAHATETDYEPGGTKPPAKVQNRFRLLAGGSFDVLNIAARRPAISLRIGPQLTINQIPFARDEQRVTELGLGGFFTYDPWEVTAELRWYPSQSQDFGLRWVAPLGFWNIVPYVQYYQPTLFMSR